MASTSVTVTRPRQPSGGRTTPAVRPTSRRTRHSVPWGGTSSARRPAAQVVDQLVEGAGADVAEEAPVHRQARGAAAEGDALHLLEGELAVVGGAPGGHAQRGLGVLQQLHPAVEQAGQVGAHRHQVAAHRLGEEHVVEAGRAVDLGPGEAEQLADVLHGLGREPPVLLLGHVEHRDQRRPGLGVQGDQVLGPLDVLRREPRHQRRPSSAELVTENGSRHRCVSPVRKGLTGRPRP